VHKNTQTTPIAGTLVLAYTAINDPDATMRIPEVTAIR
jgi:hypothetical protein